MQDLPSLKGFDILTRIRDCGMPKISFAIWRDCAKIWVGMTGLENLIGDSLPYSFIRELKQRRRGRRREWQTSNRVRLAKQYLCTCITLFCTFLGSSFFLPSLHNYDVESGYRVSWRT